MGFFGTLGPGGPLGSTDGPLGFGSSGVIHSSGITGLMTLLYGILDGLGLSTSGLMLGIVLGFVLGLGGAIVLICKY